MSHRRKNIRDAIVGLLKAAATSAGDRVYGDRVLPLFAETYPLILVFARDESSTPRGNTPSPMVRSLAISIAIMATAGADESLDDILDGMCLQVEAAIKADPQLKQTAITCGLISTEFDASPEGEKVLGGARLTYEVTYTD